ncbi:MAG: hypothetical protein ACI857_003003 [Arenicella sp.]|jgi:hypothetical protein
MKNRKLLMLLLVPFMMACGGEDTEATDEVIDEIVEEACTYSYNAENTILTWTAFKLTEKKGVDGSFNEINVIANESDNMFDVLNGATFEIPIVSVNSQDEVRDPKIRDSFFGSMDSTLAITGEVVSIDGSGATISITMNGVSVAYKGEVKVEEETITVTMTIDIVDFDAQPSLDAIADVCAEKHTGEDGINKFWTDVNIAVQTKLNKECK